MKETYNPTADFNGNSQVISVSKYSITYPHNLIQSSQWQTFKAIQQSNFRILHRFSAASLGGACGQGYNEVRQSLKLSPYWKSVFSSLPISHHFQCNNRLTLHHVAFENFPHARGELGGCTLFGVNVRPLQVIEVIMGDGRIFDNGPFFVRLWYYSRWKRSTLLQEHVQLSTTAAGVVMVCFCSRLLHMITRTLVNCFVICIRCQTMRRHRQSRTSRLPAVLRRYVGVLQVVIM